MSFLKQIQKTDATPAAYARPPIILDRWQYRLSSTPHPWSHPLGSYWLSLGEGLPQTIVRSPQGKDLGILLGFPIDLNAAALVRGTWTTPPERDARDDAAIANVLNALGGRYIWIVPHRNGMRIYPDAAAQISCVWDASTDEVGSTAGAILQPSEYERRFDRKLFDQLDITNGGWFPGGLTAHDGVARLLPNHYLDLRSLTAHRFAIPTTSHPSQAVCLDGFRDIVNAQLTALRQGSHQPVVTLNHDPASTGLMACLKGHVRNLQWVTVKGRHRAARVKQLVAAFNLRHSVQGAMRSDNETHQRFLKRSGHCTAMTDQSDPATFASWADRHCLIDSNGYDIADCPLWTEQDPQEFSITPALLADRLGLKSSTALEKALSHWIDNLPDGIQPRPALDLAYLELGVGAGNAARFCADPSMLRISPFITYRTVQMMQSLPKALRRNGQLSRALVTRHWPAIDTFPYETLRLRSRLTKRLQSFVQNLGPSRNVSHRNLSRQTH